MALSPLIVQESQTLMILCVSVFMVCVSVP